MTNTNPHECAEKMMSLSEEQSRLIDEITELEENEAKFLYEHKEKYGSDKATLMAWRVTQDGLRQNRVDNRLKAIKGELSVLKNYLRHCENSARSLY